VVERIFMALKKSEIVGYVIFYPANGQSSGVFTRTKSNLRTQVVAMLNKKPGVKVCIQPVNHIPEWVQE